MRRLFQGAHSTASRAPRQGQTQPATRQQRLWYWLCCQYIEILELPEIAARTFLQFRQRHLIDGKTARIEWRSWGRGSGLRRHHIGLIHFEGGHCELAFGIIHHGNHLVECHWDLYCLSRLRSCDRIQSSRSPHVASLKECTCGHELV